MKHHIVREIKKHHHILVANAMFAEGYSWLKRGRPTNIDRMVEGLPKPILEKVLARLEK